MLLYVAQGRGLGISPIHRLAARPCDSTPWLGPSFNDEEIILDRDLSIVGLLV